MTTTEGLGHWSIYTEMKRHYYETGHILTRKEIGNRYVATDEELDEAMAEFEIFCRHCLPDEQQNLLERIRKGEAFIESLDKSDPLYQAAEDKLCKLIDELGEMET
jgi:hypothetical protein